MAKEVQLHELFTIARSRADLVAAWRDPGQMTRFIPHLKSVTALDGKTLRHVARNVGGEEDVVWDSEFADDPAASTLSWNSLEGAPVKHDGKITFQEVRGGRGTVIGLSLRYEATVDDSAPKVAP